MLGATGMEVLHVTTPEGWAETMRVGGLQEAPFLHLCTEAQLRFVLAKHFAGRTGLVVVRLDPAGLDVRWENSEAGMGAFPHLYGFAPVSAALEVRAVGGVEFLEEGGRGDAGEGRAGCLRSR